MLIIGVLVLAAMALALPVLTGLGDRRRGHAIPHVVFAGLFFPVTWIVWHLIDARPFQRPEAASLDR